MSMRTQQYCQICGAVMWRIRGVFMCPTCDAPEPVGSVRMWLELEKHD